MSEHDDVSESEHVSGSEHVSEPEHVSGSEHVSEPEHVSGSEHVSDPEHVSEHDDDDDREPGRVDADEERDRVIITTHMSGRPEGAPDPDEALSTRLRDLALVNLDALTAGLDGARAQALVGAYADDCADALKEARARILALKRELAGPDPLNVLDLAARQRASDAGHAGAERVRDRLGAQAEAGRGFARLADLAAGLIPRLFEADRRR